MDLNEITRLLLNLIRKGSVKEVDHAAKKCRISTGDSDTNWIPWITLRAGATRTWSPPTVGEQVLLFCPGGDAADGVALCGIYSDNGTAPSESPSLHVVQFPDGAVIQYDHQAHALSVNLPGGTISIESTGGVTINASGGNVVVNGDVVADGISLKNHVHGGVVPGPANTGKPK